MKLRKILIPSLLLPLALLAGCGSDELPESPPDAPPADYGTGPTDEPSSESDIVEGENDKPTVDEDLPTNAVADWSAKPGSLTEADLTAEEQDWLAFVAQYETNPEGDFDHDELNVSQGIFNGELNVKATTDDGRGAAFDGATGEKYIIRLYTPSPETQKYVETLAPAIEAWEAKYDDWPSAGWDMMEDQWVLEPGSMDEYKAKPVVLDLPETFSGGGYAFMNDSGGFTFTNEETNESVQMSFEDGAYVDSVSAAEIPLS